MPRAEADGEARCEPWNESRVLPRESRPAGKSELGADMWRSRSSAGITSEVGYLSPELRGKFWSDSSPVRVNSPER